MSRLRRAFTLVELLVVIGIIAVLMGIFLPALSSARASGRMTLCASNLRQLQVAAMNYAVDNGGFLPPAHVNFFTKNLDRWHGTRPNQSSPFDFATSRLKTYLQVSHVKQCPDFEPAPGGIEQSAGGYGYNDRYLGSSIGIPGVKNADNIPAKISQVRKPAETILFTDVAKVMPQLVEYSFVEPPLNLNAPPGWQQNDPSIHFRHRGSANIVWLDGHVDLQRMEWTYPTSAGYPGANMATAFIGFFGPKDNSLFDRD